MTPNNTSHLDFSNLREMLAAVAHACWCKKLIDEGWRLGDKTDLAAMTHAELRPYADLSPRLRAHLRMDTNTPEVKRGLINGIELHLNGFRLTFDEVSVGSRMQVRDDPDEEVGIVESIQPSQEEPEVIATISVRWPDGTLEECIVWELILAEDPSSERRT